MYKKHVEQLAAQYNISFIYTGYNEYDTETGLVSITEPIDELTYFEALHELGHAFYAHKPISGYQLISCEQEAWDWALMNSILKPSRQVNRHIAMCMKAVIGLYG